MVLVDDIVRTTDTRLYLSINLSKKPWSSLNINKLTPFRVEEKLRPSPAYPNGVFPGNGETSTSQYGRVVKFRNFIEFCKVVEDEVIVVNGARFLSTKFYERRHVGWSSNHLRKKIGNCIGYCVGGEVYPTTSIEKVNKIIYEFVYGSLVTNTVQFRNLKAFLKSGLGLHIVGTDKELCKHLGTLLTSTS